MKPLQHRIVDNKVYQRIVVHEFRLSDVEDPEIYAAAPLWEWEQSEAGQFVMSRALETPKYHQQIDHSSFHYLYHVTAWLLDSDVTYYCLKWK